MKQKLRAKLFILVLAMFIFTSFVMTSNVNATNSILTEKQKVISNIAVNDIATVNMQEEKIMEYDARTGITKEVDMEELSQSVSLKQKTRGIVDSIEPYDPLSKKYIIKN